MKPSDAASLLPSLPQGADILILRLRSLGDMVLETPAIAALHAWRPDLRISVLAEPWCAAVVEGNPGVMEILISREFMKTVREIRERRFSIVFNQHGGPRSVFLSAASGAKVRVGWKGFQYSFLYNARVPDVREFYGTNAVHTVKHRMSQFYWCGLPLQPIPRTQVFPQPDAIESVSRMLSEQGIAPGEPYSVLQPGARLETMRWPAGKFAEIARWLLESHGIASVVNLGPRDNDIAALVRGELRDCAAILETLDARQLIALLAGARIFVGNDSGPAHIAAAAERACVVIFGGTSPVQWGPWQAESRVVSTGAIFESRRGDKSVAVREPRPIAAIGVDEVRDACEELLMLEAGVKSGEGQK
ncbi:MAG: glycosyltransferase family 9 protein [Candidatus Acidiferrales bacterium]